MVATLAPLRSGGYMPPAHRWIVYLEPEVETLGKRIRRERERLGFSQERLAQALGLKEPHMRISRWERDQGQPDEHERHRMAMLFEVPESELAQVATYTRDYLRKRRAGEWPTVPGPALAVPDDPEVRALMEALLDPSKPPLPDAYIRSLAERVIEQRRKLDMLDDAPKSPDE